MLVTSYEVVIPEWQNHYVKAQKTSPKYWLWKDRDKLPKKHLVTFKNEPLKHGKKLYCQDSEGNRFLKNTLKAGKQNVWILNGQALYNATMDWRLRKKVAVFFHNYFEYYIKNQLSPITVNKGEYLSVSCDIYEIKRGQMPDIGNMWVLEKFFEDALQSAGIIEDDSPDYVRESGRKKYHWVTEASERKLVFKIDKYYEEE